MTEGLWGSVYPAETLINAKRQAIPLFATFELTPRCNMHCGMCYVHLSDAELKKRGRELTADEWLALAQQAKENGTLFLTITGGEPTVHPEFCRIYTELCKMGFIITLQSNLYHFSDECWELIIKYPPQSIKFTLYGACNETYEKVCGVKDGFTRVCGNIERLQRSGIRLTAVTTITKDNFHELRQIADCMRKRNIPWASSSAVKQSGRGVDNNAGQYRIDDSCYADLCGDVARAVAKVQARQATKPCEICREYKTGFWLKWNGNMGFCSFLDEPDINAAAIGFAAAWHRLVAFEEALTWPEACLHCDIAELCPRCAALLATESGSLYRVNEAYCRYMKKMVKERGGENNG